MPSGLAVSLPLMVDETFGVYNLITDFETLVTQNLKMLILTNPGERMMDVNFGAGVRRRLFEQNAVTAYASIEKDILSQVNRYMPFVKVERIEFRVPENNPDLYPHTVKIRTYFKIIPLQSFSILEIDVDSAVG